MNHAIAGLRPWGFFSVQPGRYGMTVFRLVVFPPGTTPSEMLRFRQWRAWPCWGAAVWFLTLIIGGFCFPETAFAAACVGYAASGACSFLVVGSMRHQVHEFSGLFSTELDDFESIVISREFSVLSGALVAADCDLRLGKMSAMEYEFVWSGVYSALPHPAL